ncbi:50S ribosomal protein L7/L12 [Fastidiosipila sanguinis]|uniref:Large ribosomal subunit protein bL12 n=1 Tax=Fastidiosipila sanguinis TaxID=236753 RepID=A0A2S0KNI9_9FIRM|nr:50S ribosomal protein L7/L12 [Fastidiosipila sanguinis]AVM42600.1 50S ribosomal protein L7/L12 [Fastidiosipila sanguinis]
MASEKITSILDSIKELNVIELNELVETIEEEFGVSAAAVAVAAPGAAGGAAAEEQTEFTVTMTDFGDSKIKVIKVVREITGLGLKEAKELVDGVPSVIKEDVEKEEAEDIKAKLEEVGAKVEIK